MTKRSPEQVYATLRQAGWADKAAIIMTAIAGGESGYDDQNLGDVSIQTSEWGPSYGLFQIRTKKSESGTGSNRDQLWLAQSDLNQAKAALAISSGGTNFSPWTVYNKGIYQRFMTGAQSAARTVGSNLSKWISGPVGGAVGSVGGVAAGAIDSAITPLLEGGRTLGITLAIAGLGGLLIIAGMWVSAQPANRRAKAVGLDVAKTVAKVVK